EGDFDRPETLDAALAGVERALLLTPPSPKTFEFQRDFIEASKRAGVRRVVKFSAFGADASAPEGFGKWPGQAEDYLRESGLAGAVPPGRARGGPARMARRRARTAQRNLRRGLRRRGNGLRARRRQKRADCLRPVRARLRAGVQGRIKEEGMKAIRVHEFGG